MKMNRIDILFVIPFSPRFAQVFVCSSEKLRLERGFSAASKGERRNFLGRRLSSSRKHFSCRWQSAVFSRVPVVLGSTDHEKELADLEEFLASLQLDAPKPSAATKESSSSSTPSSRPSNEVKKGNEIDAVEELRGYDQAGDSNWWRHFDQEPPKHPSSRAAKQYDDWANSALAELTDELYGSSRGQSGGVQWPETPYPKRDVTPGSNKVEEEKGKSRNRWDEDRDAWADKYADEKILPKESDKKMSKALEDDGDFMSLMESLVGDSGSKEKEKEPMRRESDSDVLKTANESSYMPGGGGAELQDLISSIKGGLADLNATVSELVPP
eukprot:CAMPEP_0184667266 /NCGR_PEP_ID=MMETSP0308-20130426/66325_1 /TAXON_ID=38269 /ORGANISM="Gloeochaete witrockiana, Strain SAG 46.84" /LENGTH=326 /DNA_ID=CAMNT_0027112355 /DNA_START=109 /DNA_END=1086 /DNA_ORIENTATION=-